SLPGYYGIAPGSWAHWAKVWNIDLDWLKKRFASDAMMTKPGTTVSRWIDGVLEPNDVIGQGPNLRAVFYWGHAPTSKTGGLDRRKPMDAIELLVVIARYPWGSAAMAAMPTAEGGKLNPNRTVYLLPACTQFETSGSVTASNRAVQWREKVIEPLFE